MLLPTVVARVEEADDRPTQRIDCRKIWPLIEVAPIACQREVLKIVSTCVLLGSHVFDVK